MQKLIKRGKGLCLKAISEDGEIVGILFAAQESLIAGKESEEKWMINLTGVIPERTGQGIGAELLKEIEKLVKQRDVKKMFVSTNKGDEKVVHFYQKNGYQDAGWVKDYQYGEGNSAVFLLKYL